jgi:hypothetical protein
MNADERRLKTLYVVRVPGSSSAAVTDCFVSSNLLLILSIISDKCWPRRGERRILAQVAMCLLTRFRAQSQPS